MNPKLRKAFLEKLEGRQGVKRQDLRHVGGRVLPAEEFDKCIEELLAEGVIREEFYTPPRGRMGKVYRLSPPPISFAPPVQPSVVVSEGDRFLACASEETVTVPQNCVMIRIGANGALDVIPVVPSAEPIQTRTAREKCEWLENELKELKQKYDEITGSLKTINRLVGVPLE